MCTYTVGYVRSTWRPFPTRSPEISFLLRFEVIQHFCWCKSGGSIAGRMDLSTYFVVCSMLLQCPGQQQWRRVEEERPPSCFSRLYGIARGLSPMQTVQLNAELKLRKRRLSPPRPPPGCPFLCALIVSVEIQYKKVDSSLRAAGLVWEAERGLSSATSAVCMHCNYYDFCTFCADISSPIQDIVIIPKGWDVDEYTQIAVHSTASTLHQTSTSSTASSSSSSPSIITQFNIPNKLATESQ